MTLTDEMDRAVALVTAMRDHGEDAMAAVDLENADGPDLLIAVAALAVTLANMVEISTGFDDVLADAAKAARVVVSHVDD